MKTVRNVTIAALLAASPLAFAHGGGESGCQGARASDESKSERHAGHQAERHARMVAMHEGMHQGMGAGMRQGQRHGQEQGKTDKQEEHKH